MSTTLGRYSRNPKDYLGHGDSLDPASPDTFIVRNMTRDDLTDAAGDTNSPAYVDGVMISVPVQLRASEVVTSISVQAGSTAGASLTHSFAALYDTSATPALLAQSADNTAAAWAARTWRTFTLAAPYTVPKSGKYWVGILVAGTTPPSGMGSLAARKLVTGEGNAVQSSGSSLTATAPATIASPAEWDFVPLVVIQ